MKPGPYKILLLEDNRFDAELIEHELSNLDFEFRFLYVEDEAAFRTALVKFAPDLILSDHSMRHFSGMDALRVKKELVPDTPFLIVTGSLSEEIAVECIHAGAEDYIIKEHLVRLCPAIHRAVEKQKTRVKIKQTEAELRESLRRYQQLLDSANDAIFVYQLDNQGLPGPFIEVNKNAYQTLEYTRSQLLKRTMTDIIAEDHRDDIAVALGQLKKNKIYIGESVLKTRTGTRIPIENSSHLFKLRRTPTVMVVSRNIQRRKIAEQKIRERENQIRLLLDSTAEGIYGLDLDGNCTMCNRAGLRLLGYSDQQDVIGKNMHQLIHHIRADGSEFRTRDCRIFKTFKKNAEIHVTDEVFWRSDGSSFPVEYWSYPIIKEEKTVGAVVTFLDITERVKADQERDEALLTAQRASRVKANFLGNMTHEIRTPLNGIVGFVDLLKYRLSDVDDPEIDQYFKHIDISTKRILATIHGILDISMLEAEAFQTNNQPVSLDETIRIAIDSQIPLTQKKGLVISFSDESDNPVITADEYCVTQAIMNLIDNAVKYTDTGIGMSEEFLRRMYEPYTQESEGHTKKYQGIGLGLALTKRYLERIGARIEVSSQKGQGTTFKLSFQQEPNV